MKNLLEAQKEFMIKIVESGMEDELNTLLCYEGFSEENDNKYKRKSDLFILLRKIILNNIAEEEDLNQYKELLEDPSTFIIEKVKEDMIKLINSSLESKE